MWRALTEAVGVAARDALWDYPDLLPEAHDIDDPSGLIARLEATRRGEEPEPDEMDAALAELLAEAEDSERAGGPVPEEGPVGEEEEGPEGPRPV